MGVEESRLSEALRDNLQSVGKVGLRAGDTVFGVNFTVQEPTKQLIWAAELPDPRLIGQVP